MIVIRLAPQIAAIGAIMLVSVAHAQSFSCSQAVSPVEKAICADAGLAEADMKLAEAYNAAKTELYLDLAPLKHQQIQWLKSRSTRCVPSDRSQAEKDPAFISCLGSLYRERIAVLAASKASDACSAIATALKSHLNEEVTGRSFLSLADIPTRASYKRGGPDQIGDFSLESTIAGSLLCQEPHLFRRVGKDREEVEMPRGFGSEDQNCKGDWVLLTEVSGAPTLVEESGEGTVQAGTTRLSISQWKGNRWGPSCSLSVETKATYEVAMASCAGGHCGGLRDLALHFLDVLRSPDIELPDEGDVSVALKEKYLKMLELAKQTNLKSSSEVPYFEVETEQKAADQDSCQISFDGSGGFLFPVEMDGDVIMGKIGNDGFGLGGHSGGPNSAVAFYRLVKDDLTPIAGFCVVPRHVLLDTVESGN